MKSADCNAESDTPTSEDPTSVDFRLEAVKQLNVNADVSFV